MSKQVGSATAGPVAAGAAAEPGGLTATSASATGSQDVVPFISQVPGTPVYFPSFHGRAVSWVSVSLVMVAFLVGGLSLCIGPTWWLFWVAVGVAAVGGLMALSTGIFDDWY